MDEALWPQNLLILTEILIFRRHVQNAQDCGILLNYEKLSRFIHGMGYFFCKSALELPRDISLFLFCR